MKLKINILILTILALLISCKTDKIVDGIPPSPPDWLDVKLSFDKLPGYMEPAELRYEITVIGDDSSYYVSPYGDTLDHLWMRFSASEWCQPLNADADTLFDEKVYIGQKILFNPIFQITMDKKPLWTHIDLKWGFYSLTLKQSNLDSIIKPEMGAYSLFFNHHTGEYSFP